ncbi:MAG TPA: hypothetical protein PLU37_08980 [Chitinophagaceae bacterium]|nr:hypothetical protein [Chitinophagaceae bacterium]
MKNRILAAFLILTAVLFLSSCYTSRKQGCPANPTSNYRFKG